MTEKKTFTISIVALVVSIITFFYSVIIQERGILLGRQAYFIAPVKKIKIGNDVVGLYIKMNLSIHNTGTVPLMCNKIEAFLKSNNEEHVLTSLSSFSLQPKQIWNDQVTLDQRLPSEIRRDRSALRMAAAHDVMVKYHQKNDNTSPISVSSEIYQKMADALKTNTKWLSADDPYLLLIVFWMNTTSDEPSEKILYRFSMNREMIELITDPNIESLKTPDVIKNNQFVNYYATPDVALVADKQRVDTTYGCYKNLKVTN